MTHTNRSRRLQSLGAALLFAAVTTGVIKPASATVMVEIPLPQLVATADLVVRGVVVRTGTRVSIEAGILVPRTHTWIEVSEALAGPQPPRVVELAEPGGHFGAAALGGERWEETTGVPRYRVGEEVVAILKSDNSRQGLYRTHEMAQGKYRVLRGRSGEALAARDLDEVLFASWGTQGLRLEKPTTASTSVTLRALVAAIREVAPESGGRSKPTTPAGGLR